MNELRLLLQAIESGTPAVHAMVIAVRGSAPRGPGARLVVLADGTTTGTVGGGEVEAEVLAAARELLSGRAGTARTLEIDSRCGGVVTVFLELFSSPRLLTVIGAGNVGRAVAELAVRVGFVVTLVDRGGNLGFPAIAGVNGETASDPEWLATVRQPNATQLVVATGSHDADIAWAVTGLAGGFAGVGVVGSRHKAAAIRRAAAEAGLAPERIAVLRAPIGLDLGAVTPAEIALAVVAELVLLSRRGEVPPSWRKPSQP